MNPPNDLLDTNFIYIMHEKENQVFVFVFFFRCSLMSFLIGLCTIYPDYSFWFQALGYLDMSRMWMRMYRYMVYIIIQDDNNF